MNVLEIIITVFSNIIFLYTYLACFQAWINLNTLIWYISKTFSFLPKQYADEQISKGVSSYTKKVPQFFIWMKWLLEQGPSKLTWHSWTVLVSPGVSGMSSKSDTMKYVYNCCIAAVKKSKVMKKLKWFYEVSRQNSSQDKMRIKIILKYMEADAHKFLLYCSVYLWLFTHGYRKRNPMKQLHQINDDFFKRI